MPKYITFVFKISDRRTFSSSPVGVAVPAARLSETFSERLPAPFPWLSPHGPEVEISVVRVELLDSRDYDLQPMCRFVHWLEMTESKAGAAPGPPKELLALNPEQESEFKKKVQAAKKKKRSSKVGREPDCGLKCAFLGV